jgi:hypothetical protein
VGENNWRHLIAFAHSSRPLGDEHSSKDELIMMHQAAFAFFPGTNPIDLQKEAAQ